MSKSNNEWTTNKSAYNHVYENRSIEEKQIAHAHTHARIHSDNALRTKDRN